MKQTSKRRENILSQLKENGSVSVIELSQEFDVSTVTIRNDLAYLEKKGLLMRSHGGAISVQDIVPETTIEVKTSLNTGLKASIAQVAADMVKDGDNIILDSGTTTEKIAQLLGKKKGVVAMTNGLNIAQSLSQYSDVEVMITGGSLRRKSQSFYGTQAEDNLRSFNFSKLFLGVDGFHIDSGITTHNENEARLNRMMCEVANEVIVVTDSSKFGKLSLHKIIPSEKINTLITDNKIPKEYKLALMAKGINVITV
ncbi:DeoR family transcriptional regulator [Vibrio sp. T187]|uniref:transcriptional repressor AgaR n=1 Tax=Vibrio TaxID=662 RepID=UPI0010C93E44|nr:MULTISPECIES: transcriptional repressor AgaR [Vibrio]MBW3698214.1 DeoR family transcriptional regulator [Vibrio sp. T187]